MRTWLTAIALLLPSLAAAQPPKTQYVQTDEIRRVHCESEDYTLATIEGAVRVFLLDGTDADCPGPKPAECTFGADPLVPSMQLGLCPGATTGGPRCLEVTLKPACDSPDPGNCRHQRTYQVHALVNTTGASPDRLACDFRVVVRDVRYGR